jgi:hypothetical protein
MQEGLQSLQGLQTHSASAAVSSGSILHPAPDRARGKLQPVFLTALASMA